MSTLDAIRGAREEVLERVYSSDRSLILGTILAIYAVYVGIGLFLGFNINGLVNALVRLTFLIAAYAMAGLALNLHWGYTGLFNVGVAGFMAVAVYVMGIATAPVDPATSVATPGLGLPAVVGIVLGMVAAGLVGLVAAAPALRLRSDYLAIVTIGMAEIIRLSLTSNTLTEFSLFGLQMGTGGNGGLNLVGDPSKVIRAIYDSGYGFPVVESLAGTVVNVFQTVGIERQVTIELTYVLVLIGFVALFYWTFSNLGRSPFGRVLKAIREDEDVASSLGKNVQLMKIKSFVIGSALLGLAGIFWMGSRGLATPSTFRTEVTVFVWIVVILGGAGSNTGSVLGAALFVSTLLQGPRYLRTVITETIQLPSPPLTVYRAGEALFGGNPVKILAFVLDRLGSLQFVILGVVLIYLVHRRPQGLLGDRKEIAATIDLERTRNEGKRSDDRAGNPTTDGGKHE